MTDRETRLGYVIALASVVVATVGRLALDPLLGTRFPFATLFFAVLVSAWFGGLGPALLASGCGALAAMLLLLAPRGGSILQEPDTAGGLALYLGVSVGIALIGGRMRRALLRAEAEGREAAARREDLSVTLRSIGDAVVTTDVDGCVTSLNPIAEHLTGWTTEGARGRGLGEVLRIVNEQTRDPVENPATRVLAEGRIVGLANHTVLIARDGREHPIEDSAAPIRDHRGDLRGVVLVFRDVSERRRAEQRVRASEQELSDFFENANVGLHWVGPDGILLRVNRAELEMLGYEAEEYLGRHIAEFHVDQGVIADILARLAAGESLVGCPARMRCKDGSIKEVLINSTVRWEDGRFLHTRCFTLDVTERNRVEEAQALLASVVESSDDAIVTKTLDGIVTSWNAGAERLFGYSREEAVGQSIHLVIPPDRRDEERGILERLRRGERVDAFDTVRAAKGGRLIDVSVRVSPVRDRSGAIIGASKLARDITASRRAERALREEDRRKDEFLAVLAHELRNPLAPVRNSLEVMKRAAGDPALLRQAHQTMDRQMAHLERLVDDLLDVARMRLDRLVLRRQPVELASIAYQAVEACRPLAEGAGIDLSVLLPTQPVYLNADGVRLAQVFSNLLNNACKFSQAGGRVSLAAECHGGEVVVSVRDEGRGMPPETLSHVFEMFTQLEPATERTQGGLGIGLTLVRRLVELHGGRVEAFSEGLGRGSEFVVHLPLSADVVSPAAPPEATEPSAPRRRVLIVDDNVDAAESLGILLRLSGHETALAYDGQQAIDLASSFLPDVILLDIGLPKMSGHEVARRIREQPWGRGIVLIAVTGWGQDEDRRKSQEVGFEHHLLKPVDASVLLNLLATL